jgi:hypothetical protein
MAKQATGTIFSSNDGASGYVYEGGIGNKAIVIENQSETSFSLYVNASVGAVGHWLRYHWVAIAEL